jgi:putative polyhydroxyalkanoate system protein
MSDVRVVEPHNTTPTDALGKISSFEDMLKKYGVKPKWAGTSAKIKSPGVKGRIVIDETNVTVELSLGMMAKAVGIDAGRLEGSIRKRLKAAFTAE